jgi:hypothetical protein
MSPYHPHLEGSPYNCFTPGQIYELTISHFNEEDDKRPTPTITDIAANIVSTDSLYDQAAERIDAIEGNYTIQNI